MAALLSGAPVALHAAVPGAGADQAHSGQIDTQALDADAGKSKLRIPVEVVSKGSDPEWVYVEVENQAVPEPGFLPLLLLPALLMLRRRRGHTG